MKWIGITGSIGSGKSTVATLVEELGHPVIRADVVSRQMTSKGSPVLDQIEKEFGKGVFGSDGELDRQALSKLVFGNTERLKKLESILHPPIQKHVRDWRKGREQEGCPMAFYDIPLLYENNLKSQFDSVICVTAGEEQIVQRVQSRSGLSREEILQRLSHQVPMQEKANQSEYVIDNSGNLEDLKKKVKELIAELES